MIRIWLPYSSHFLALIEAMTYLTQY